VYIPLLEDLEGDDEEDNIEDKAKESVTKAFWHKSV
jgi:hypothetical protein